MQSRNMHFSTPIFFSNKPMSALGVRCFPPFFLCPGVTRASLFYIYLHSGGGGPCLIRDLMVYGLKKKRKKERDWEPWAKAQALMLMPLSQVMRFVEAEADAERALQLEAPVLNPKTLLRRATARQGQQKFRGARADYKQVRVVLRPPNGWQALTRALRPGSTVSLVV